MPMNEEKNEKKGAFNEQKMRRESWKNHFLKCNYVYCLFLFILCVWKVKESDR